MNKEQLIQDTTSLIINSLKSLDKNKAIDIVEVLPSLFSSSIDVSSQENNKLTVSLYSIIRENDILIEDEDNITGQDEKIIDDLIEDLNSLIGMYSHPIEYTYYIPDCVSTNIPKNMVDYSTGINLFCIFDDTILPLDYQEIYDNEKKEEIYDENISNILDYVASDIIENIGTIFYKARDYFMYKS